MVRGIPLPVLFAILLLLVSGGAVGLVMINLVAAMEGVEDVAKSLEKQISDRVVDEIIEVLQRPFIGLERLRTYADSETVEVERWDGLNYETNMKFLHQITTMDGWGSNVYFCNNYGHIQVSYTDAFPAASGNNKYRFLLSPPREVAREGYPSWTIPCRYQSNCTDPSNALNHKYCMNESQLGTLNFLDRPVTSSDILAEYSKWPTDPSWAAYAVSQNLRVDEHTYCRPNATFAKEPCEDAVKGCLEFNMTFFFLEEGISMETIEFQKDLTYFDIRARQWYREAIVLPAYSQYYADVILCASTGLPCMIAVTPYDAFVPDEGATVTEIRSGLVGVVEGFEPSVKEMHTPIVRFPGMSQTRTINRRQLKLTCDTQEACQPLSISLEKQVTVPKRIGVLASDFYFKELLTVARAITAGKTGAVFFGIFEPKAPLLSTGYPCNAELLDPKASCAYYIDPDTDKLALASSFDPYVGSIVSGVMRKLFEPVYDPTTKEWSSTIMEYKNITFDKKVSTGGSEYWTRFTPVATRMRHSYNLNWWVCVVIPKDDYLSEVEKQATTSLVVSATTIFLLLLVVTAIMFLFVVRPVHLMVVDFQRACAMQLEFIVDRPTSIVNEIVTLQQCFGVLTTNLRLYRSFLPPSILGIDEFIVEEEDVMSVAQAAGVGSFSMASQSISSGMSAASDNYNNLNHQLKQHLMHGLQKRIVTIVSVGLTVPDVPVSHMDDLLCRVCSGILVAAGRQSCMEEFRGDLMKFSWNAKKNCTMRTEPCTRALAIYRCKKDFPGIEIGIASGETLCGPMGSESHKVKVIGIMGPCVAESYNLMQLNRCHGNELKSHILLEKNTLDMIFSYQMFEITFVEAYAGCSNEGGRLIVFSLISEPESKSGEWMYTIESDISPLTEWLAYLEEKGPVSGKEWGVKRIDQLSKSVPGSEYSGEFPSIKSLFHKSPVKERNPSEVAMAWVGNSDNDVSELVLLPPSSRL